MVASAAEKESSPRGLDLESRKMVLNTIEQLSKRLLTREKIFEIDKSSKFPEEIIRKMLSPELGLQLVFIPEEYGGMGGGARDSVEVIRGMAKICLGICTAFFAIQLGADPLLVGGTEDQKKKWIGAIAEGNALMAYAVTEPDAGSNLAALKTKAEPVVNAAGEVTGYKINGSKQFISTGKYADFITLLAKTPEGPTFFVVEKEAKGYSRGKGEDKHGIHASNTSSLSFTDVFVPIENLIGGVSGAGMKQSNKVFGYTRLMVAAMALGAGEAAMNIVIPYAGERVQFGSPISEKQGYTHKLVVPHAVRLEAAAAYIEEVALRLDSGDEDLQAEGSIAKLFTTEIANKAADDAIQALGGYGYIVEYGVEKIKRDVKITCIYEGTSEIQQNIISTFRWKKTRKTKGGFYNGIKLEMENMNSAFPGAGCSCHAFSTNALNETINLVHHNKLTRKQYVMFLVADMVTYVEIGVSFARKAKALSDSQSPDAEKIKVMSRIFACEVAQLVTGNMLKILMGTGIFEKSEVSDFLDSVSYTKMLSCNNNTINDMDKVADILFERL